MDDVTAGTEGQGDTGADGGSQGGGFLDSLGETNSGNEVFSGIENAEQLGQKYLDLNASNSDLQSKLPQTPEAADKYAFNKPEDFGFEVDEAGLSAFKDVAFENNFTQDQFQFVMEQAAKRDQQAIDSYQKQRQEAVDSVKTKMGDQFEPNVNLAKKALGDAAPEDMSDLISGPIFDRLIYLGRSISEDTFGSGQGAGGSDADTAAVLFNKSAQHFPKR